MECQSRLGADAALRARSDVDAGDLVRTKCSHLVAMTAAKERRALPAVLADAVRQDVARRTARPRPEPGPARSRRVMMLLPATELFPRAVLQASARSDDELARPARLHLHRQQRSFPAHRTQVRPLAPHRQRDAGDVSSKIRRPARERAPAALPPPFHGDDARERQREQLPGLSSRVPTAL